MTTWTPIDTMDLSMAMMSKLQASYLAGLIDGEGYIGILRVKRGMKKNWKNARDCFYIPVLKVAMVDRPLIEWLYQSFGGSFEIRKAHGNASESYCWTLRKSQTAVFLKYIYPYLRIKKSQANIVAEFYKTNNGAGHPISDEIHQKRTQLYDSIRKLHLKKAPVETK